MAFKPAIASLSLGRAWNHTLPPKFTAAASAGLPGIEIFFEDLVYLASSYPGGNTRTNQLLAAHSIRSLADSLSLSIIAIGPFSDCEGLLSPAAKAAKLRELGLWFEMARILGTGIIQIPCTFQTEGFTGDLETVANDLREIADLGAEQNPPFKFAYENLCFGTFNDTWSKAWAVVKKVDRYNFGMCLDTFNIAGREYADPECPTGKVENAEVVFAESLRKMVRAIDVDKVFYIQVVDAERLERPLVEGHEFFVEGQRARMSWSRNCRLFACEEDRGGYLPILDVVRAICDETEGLGYKGWISFELFNRTLVENREDVPREHAERSMKSWARVSKAMGWEAVAKPATRHMVPGRKTIPRNAGAQEISARL